MLGTVDFTAAKQFEPLAPGEYDGQTKSWEPVRNKDGNGVHVKATFVFPTEVTDPETGETKTVNKTVFTRWPITSADGLWRTIRDLAALGVDPELLKSKEAVLEPALNELFGAVPTPVRAVIGVSEFGDPDPVTQERRKSNDILSIKRIG